jgi:hypothetical protein
MNYGFKLLKKHGQNYVEVTNPPKWAVAQNFSKILMVLLLKVFGPMIMKAKKVKKNYLIFYIKQLWLAILSQDQY